MLLGITFPWKTLLTLPLRVIDRQRIYAAITTQQPCSSGSGCSCSTGIAVNFARQIQQRHWRQHSHTWAPLPVIDGTMLLRSCPSLLQPLQLIWNLYDIIVWLWYHSLDYDVIAHIIPMISYAHPYYMISKINIINDIIYDLDCKGLVVCQKLRPLKAVKRLLWPCSTSWLPCRSMVTCWWSQISVLLWRNSNQCSK